MFKAFGAAPVSIPWAETYSAMQTHIADGLEQPLIGLLVDKMYEVQKHCSLTNHMWDGFWILSNKRVWEGIPANLRRRAQHQRGGDPAACRGGKHERDAAG